MLPHQEAAAIDMAIEGIIKGYPHDELCVKLQEEFDEAPVEELQKYIKKAVALICDQTLTDIDLIIPQHIELYEKIYQEFESLRSVPGKLKALRYKEKLIGLHKEVNSIEIHNEVNVEIEREPEYDMAKLNNEEQNKLQAYFKLIER